MILIKMPFIPLFISKPDLMKLSHSVRKLHFLFEFTLIKDGFLTIGKQDAPGMNVRVQTQAQQKCQEDEQEIEPDKFA